MIRQTSFLLVTVLMAAMVALTAVLPASAQGRVYRCGNEYTNRPANPANCQEVEGGNVTIIRGTQARPTAPKPAPRSGTPAKSSISSTGGSSNSDILQRRRDADRRAILENELAKARDKQNELQVEYKDGQPDKIGGEAHNYQKYLDRVADLKASIARNQADIEGIQRELDRLP